MTVDPDNAAGNSDATTSGSDTLVTGPGKARATVVTSDTDPRRHYPAPDPLGFDPAAHPERIGPFRIVDKLGSGGMGAVYLAEQQDPVERQVALKLVHASLRSPEMLARFTAERLAMGRLSHPNIAALYEAGATDDGFPYFAMELVRGERLTDFCDNHKLDIKRRLALMMRICGAVQHAHRNGILHRDLKPGNILVAEVDGEPVPKIIDFGIAKALDEPLGEAAGLTRVGVVGTPAYICPEALAGKVVDTRADVYSLGVILYELLTDERPRELGRTPSLVSVTSDWAPALRPSHALQDMVAVRKDRVAMHRCLSPSELVATVRGDLDWITIKAVADEPEQRYGSAAELAADLQRYLDHRPVLARAPTARYRFGKFVRRNRVAALTASVLLVALLAGIVGTTTGLIKARQAETEAQAQALRADEVAKFLIELFNMSDPGRARGSRVTARELLDRGSERIDRQLADQPLIRSQLMGTISDVYEKLSQYDRAVALAEQSLLLRETELGPQAPEVADSLNAVAELYRRTSRLEQAETTHRRALTIRQAAFGNEHEAIAESLNGLAAVLSLQGKQEEAEKHYLAALDMRQRLLGPRHIDVAETRTHLGWLYLEQERFRESLVQLTDALAIRRETLGEDHYLVAETLDFLATLQTLQGQLENAQALTQEALDIYRKVLEPGHHDIGDNLLTLGSLRRLQGDYEEATQLQRQAVGIFEDALGATDREVARALFELALSSEQLGAWEDAAQAYRRALTINEAVLGANHPIVGRVLNNLGYVVGERLGRYEEAESLLRRSVAVFDQDAKPDSYWDALSRWSLANNLRDQQRHADADKFYRRALDILRDTGGSSRVDNPNLADLVADYSRSLRATGLESAADELDAVTR